MCLFFLIMFLKNHVYCHAWSWVCIGVQCPWKPAEDIGPPGAKVNCSCEPSDMGLGVWGPQSSPCSYFLTSFQSPGNFFKWPMSINTMLGSWCNCFKPEDQLGKNWPHACVEFSNPWTRVPSFLSDYFFSTSRFHFPWSLNMFYKVYAPEQSFP